MKILLISNLFPPFVMGGAEMAANSLATWLAAGGHEVRVLTSAPTPADQGSERRPDGLVVERRYFANRYQVYQAPPAPALEKARWHYRDHFHPATEQICGEVIDAFGPDVVNTHDLQGIGYNLLNAIGVRDLPCVQTLHDFGFVCLSMNMFRHGRNCSHHHLPCVASTAIKRSYFNRISKLSFISPTAALLDKYVPHLPAHASTHVIPYLLDFERPAATAETRVAGDGVQLLYVGQVEPWKGVDFVASVLDRLAATFRFRLTIVGGGSLSAALEASRRRRPWLTLAGKVPPARVGGYMARSDLLLVPSLWFENAPLVISQAIELELPVLGSNTGGIPEMVEAHINGELLPPGDEPAWAAMFARIFERPERLADWRAGSAGLRQKNAPDAVGERILDVYRRARSLERTVETASAGGTRP